MNYILDIGNVLIDFKPKVFLHSLLDNQNHEKKMNEIIFNSSEWIQLDKGTITQEDACRSFCNREPTYHHIIKKVMNNLTGLQTPITKTIELLPEIKRAGHKLYYLSNDHQNLSQYIQTKYSFLDLFDGGIFSCEIHLVKPNPEIFIYLLNKYQLKPHDCLFFDDMQQNVIAAEKIGMRGILFRNTQDIKSTLKNNEF